MKKPLIALEAIHHGPIEYQQVVKWLESCSKRLHLHAKASSTVTTVWSDFAPGHDEDVILREALRIAREQGVEAYGIVGFDKSYNIREGKE